MSESDSNISPSAFMQSEADSIDAAEEAAGWKTRPTNEMWGGLQRALDVADEALTAERQRRAEVDAELREDLERATGLLRLALPLVEEAVCTGVADIDPDDTPGKIEAFLATRAALGEQESP
jgi:hypothetical protein